MAINPTLVIGVGDAGAYAIAAAKQRFRSLLGPDMPGIAYYAVISDTSDAMLQSDRIDGTLNPPEQDGCPRYVLIFSIITSSSARRLEMLGWAAEVR